VLDIVKIRMDPNKHNTSTAFDELLEVDEGMAALDPNDQKDVVAEKLKQRGVTVEANIFTARYGVKQAAVRPVPPARAPRAAAGRGRGGRGALAAPVLKLPAGDLQHVDLKGLAPPGGFLWRANKQGSWQCHYPPFVRVSKSWNLYGHRWSAILVLRHLWEKHLSVQGLRCPQDCPVQGLFALQPGEDVAGEVLPVLAPAAAASSSSNSGRA
jgi:hypothetical protein